MQNILVAVDFSHESEVLIQKAIDIAKVHQSKVNLIHVNVNFADLYSGLIQINFDEIQNIAIQEQTEAFKQLKAKFDYPIEKCLVATGELADIINETIEELNIDLVVAGHHQDFWSKIFSSTKSILHKIKTNLLIVPLK